MWDLVFAPVCLSLVLHFSTEIEVSSALGREAHTQGKKEKTATAIYDCSMFTNFCDPKLECSQNFMHTLNVTCDKYDTLLVAERQL